MNTVLVNQLVADLLIVLAAGFLSGALCKRMGVSLLVGYLIVGAMLGEGGLRIMSQESRELEYLARAGALFLLFSIGIEFSLEELQRLSRYFLVGGAVQMLLVAVPLTIVCLLIGMTWKPALLAGTAGALSSTILVFKALAEWGQTTTPAGRRAIGVLLFQDVALVPLMLVLPMLTGTRERPAPEAFGLLLGKSLLFVVAVLLLRRVIANWIVPMLARLRSLELVVLFTLTVLGGVCWGAFAIELPPALGALAAGLVLSGNRLSKQIDTLILPYRETFAAVFFVTLGTLLHPLLFFDEPLLLAAGLVGILTLKSLAAAVALRLT
ncbi:MAG: cation:proton antiporter, partial [Planctomycetota bacterium]